MRIHPAVIAQAAATSALLMPGRFFLGVGTGENLNEHITGARWPSHRERLEMLEEAVGIIREFWEGGLVSHRGRHYTVDRSGVPEHTSQIATARFVRGSAGAARRRDRQSGAREHLGVR
jgi:G6PDH family F420-dependent oxidoreductase